MLELFGWAVMAFLIGYASARLVVKGIGLSYAEYVRVKEDPRWK